MDMTPELKAALEKQMTAYLEEYFNANASDALREKVAAEKKTVAGAYKFIESVAQAFAKAGCCAMPDALAYNLLMHYMEDEAEGAIYRPPESIQAEIEKARREQAVKVQAEKEAKAKAEKEAKAKAKAEKAKAKADAKAKKEAERARLKAEKLEAEKRKAEAVKKIVGEQLTFAF